MVTYVVTPDNRVTFENEAKHKFLDAVIQRLEGRFDTQGYTGKKRHQMQAEALLGIVAFLETIAPPTPEGEEEQSQITPKIMFSIMRGDYVTCEGVEAPEVAAIPSEEVETQALTKIREAFEELEENHSAGYEDGIYTEPSSQLIERLRDILEEF